MVDNNQAIAYLNISSHSLTATQTGILEYNLNREVLLCTSWKEIIKFITNIDEKISIDNPLVILIHIDSVAVHNSSNAEIVNMLSTISNCTEGEICTECSVVTNPNIITGIVIDKVCGADTIKQLRSSGFSGIIPCHTLSGIDATVAGIKNLIKTRSNWPKELVNKLSDTPIKKVNNIESTEIKITARQLQVLTLVCSRGLSNKMIANILKISESTVKVHISAILKAYGLRTRVQLILVDQMNKHNQK